MEKDAPTRVGLVHSLWEVLLRTLLGGRQPEEPGIERLHETGCGNHLNRAGR